MTEPLDPTPPSTHGPNGKRPDGKFAPGNKFGRGNPLAGKVAKLRATMLRSVTKADFQEVVKTLIANARGGDIAAIKELLNRTLGPAEAIDVMARLDELESRIQQFADQKGRT